MLVGFTVWIAPKDEIDRFTCRKKGYYGYMYSLVFAADMYATVFKKDPLNPESGEKYKKSILVPGGSREELESLTVRCGSTAHFEVCHTIGAKRAI